VEVVLPARRPPRERWLTRDEAARLLRAAWRGQKRRHVARFILVGLYTGTRASAICGAALKPTPGRGWVDTERGIFYRRPAGKRATKKRQTPVPLHGRLLAHIRRWARVGTARSSVVEYDGESVRTVRKGFAGAVADAGLEGKVTPHVLRHTSATWLMQGGADLLEAAQLLAMTPQLLLSTDGHHHPQHLAGALKAFDRVSGGRHKIAATEREQTSSNVVKMA
jgi:integrase